VPSVDWYKFGANLPDPVIIGRRSLESKSKFRGILSTVPATQNRSNMNAKELSPQEAHKVAYSPADDKYVGHTGKKVC